MALDLKLFYLLNDLAGHSRMFDALVVFLAAYLQYVLLLVFLVFLYVSRHAMREKLRIFLVTVFSAGIARFGVTEIIRFFYHRPRPFITYHVHQLLSDTEWSFPSGHSAFFFAMAGALYCYNKKWGTGFFVAAVLMNISRVIAGIHYPSDILGGMIVGMAVACIIFYLVERKRLQGPHHGSF